MSFILYRDLKTYSTGGRGGLRSAVTRFLALLPLVIVRVLLRPL